MGNRCMKKKKVMEVGGDDPSPSSHGKKPKQQ